MNSLISLAVGCLLLSVSFCSPLTAGEPTLTDLLRKLGLSGYPSGTRPPGFTGRTPDGKTISLSELTGKVALLNFWASWCADCRPEMPMFDQLRRDFASQGLIALGINFREGKSAVQSYAQELRLTFPLVLDLDGKIASAYGVIGLPTTFLIGRDARAVALAIGPREWAGEEARVVIRALLAEPGTLKGRR